jgi:hypothetical protein
MARSATMILGVPGGQERPSRQLPQLTRSSEQQQRLGREQININNK